MIWELQKTKGNRTYRFKTRNTVIPDKELIKITQNISDGIPSMSLKDYFACKMHVLNDCDHLVVGFDENENAIATLSSNWYKSKSYLFLHLETMIIVEEYQRSLTARHLLGCLFGALYKIHKIFPTYISLKSYNARAYSIMHRFSNMGLEDVKAYPDLVFPEKSMNIELIKEFSETLCPNLPLNENTCVIYGASGDVPNDLWKKLPETRENVVNQYFSKHLTSNDRMLCVLDSSNMESKKKILKIIEAVESTEIELLNEQNIGIELIKANESHQILTNLAK